MQNREANYFKSVTVSIMSNTNTLCTLICYVYMNINVHTKNVLLTMLDDDLAVIMTPLTQPVLNEVWACLVALVSLVYTIKINVIRSFFGNYSRVGVRLSECMVFE